MYNFEALPIIEGRSPLWERTPDAPLVIGLRSDCREVLVTRVLDAQPDHRTEFPQPSVWPFATALSITMLFAVSLFTPWGVVIGGVPSTIALIFWFWPKKADTEVQTDAQAVQESAA
jgi:cytochrome c oxidase subunit 1